MSLPVIDLIVARLQEYDPKFELRPGTAFYELFIKPLQIILQPYQIELDNIKLNQSFRRIVELEDPNAHPEDAVDSLASNVFVDRITGGKAAGVGRIYYSEPVDVVYPVDGLEFTSSTGLLYRNTAAVNMTATQMSANIENDLFYVDVSVAASDYGDSYNLEEADMLILVNDTRAITATNKYPIKGGSNRETNLDFITRTKKSIAVRDLNTGKGFTAIMFESFADTLLEAQAVGFLDPEMRRDILYNMHVGGKIDGYVKTTSINTQTFDVVGLLIDETRRISTVNYVYLYGTTPVSLRAPRVDNTERNVTVSATTASENAQFYSYADLTHAVNMVGAERIKLTIDTVTREMHIAGSVPSSTIINEIVRKINNAFGKTVTSIVINPTVKTRTNTGLCINATDRFYDSADRAFQNVAVGDQLYIYVGTNTGTYEVINKISDNVVQVDATFTADQLDVPYRVNRTGTYMKFNATSVITVDNPDVGNSALLVAFGLAAPQSVYGSQPRVYNEAVGYEVNYSTGYINRLIGNTVVADTATGVAQVGIYFYDLTLVNPFATVLENDILTVVDSAQPTLIQDYRIKEVVSNNQIRLDKPLVAADTNITYRITRTEILDGENVSVDFDYNPLSIDVGGLVPLDEYGRNRGVRPGREDYTITDMPLLDVSQVELIDPVTKEPLNQVLESRGGFGRGGFGRGGFGRGSSSEWRLKVLDPTVRFSMWENSLILIDPAYSTQSFRVTFRTCPDVSAYQTFADSDLERVLDAHVLIKHFIPALVSANIYYSIDKTNPNTPTNDEVVASIKSMINKMKAGSALDISDIVQVILAKIDPTGSGQARVKLPTTLEAVVHNSDGTKTVLSSNDQLVIPDNTVDDPNPVAPLTPRVAHWIADNITLTRV